MYVHGNNLKQKECHQAKYLDKESRQYLIEIRSEYDKWKSGNEKIKGPFIKSSRSNFKTLQKRVELFIKYKDFLDQQKYAEKFDSRSNLHSSVLEEFIFYLFRDLVFEFQIQHY